MGSQDNRRKQWLSVSSQPGSDPLSDARPPHNSQPRDPNTAAMLDELRRLRELEERREKRRSFSIGRVLILVFLLLVIVPLGFGLGGLIGGGVALLLVLLACFAS